MKSCTEKLLRGRRLLFVQDDLGLPRDLREELARVGAEIVGPATSAATVQVILSEPRRVDGAVLDLHFGGEEVLSVAQALQARGIPFVFATTDTGLAGGPRYAGYVLCGKPVFLDEIAAALFGGVQLRGSA